MHRIDGPAAAPGGFFTEGDPGVGTLATVVTDDFMNTVQEELVAVAVSAGAVLNKPNNAQVLSAIRALIGQAVSAHRGDVVASLALAVPAGAIFTFPFTLVPAGFLRCYGEHVSRTTYPDLFAAIGSTYGAGNGFSTFGLPDLRGEFIRGFDGDRGVDPFRRIGSFQGDEFRSHTHDTNISSTGGGAFAEATGDGFNNIVTGATGGTETRPRNIALLFCIKT